MNDLKCKNCRHFRQHYGLDDRHIFRLYCGHCVRSGRQKKRPDTPACGQFDPAPDPMDAFVTKEYLSKELLRYVLSLELLPNIQDEPAADGGPPGSATAPPQAGQEAAFAAICEKLGRAAL